MEIALSDKQKITSQTHGLSVKTLLEIMKTDEGQNFMHHELDREQIIHKLKECLTASSLGMIPSVKWNGERDVDGGMILLTAKGGGTGLFLIRCDAL